MNILVTAGVLAALSIQLAAISMGAEQADKPDSQPNVLFIAIDDLNDWIGSMGGHPQAQTPHMDRVASQGVLFTNAHCQAPICNPSRVSFISGKLPSTTGVYFMRPMYRDADSPVKDGQSLFDYFGANGYKTLTRGKIFHGSSTNDKFDVNSPALAGGARARKRLAEGMFDYSGTQRASKLGSYISKGLFSSGDSEGNFFNRISFESGENLSEQGKETMEIEYQLDERFQLVGEYDEYDFWNAGLRWRIVQRKAIESDQEEVEK